jgi:L-lactate dehydrogenase complex protein LldG|tara:strand:- start:102 stop:785 length:684 start_codon:yes stop_codon:yes gene_type:complete
MSDQKKAILGSIRRSMKPHPAGAEAVAQRLARHPRNLVPKRAQLDRKAQVELFISYVEAVHATVERLGAVEDVPAAAAAYLKNNNIEPRVRLSPTKELQELPWQEKAPLLDISAGIARDADPVSLTPVFCAIAESGTLMLQSGEEDPTTLNFLPETHLVLLKSSQVLGSMEEAWSKLRDRHGEANMPRTVNFVTGPSRTGDIEQTLLLGAHGPCRMHILLVDDAASE